VIQPIPFDWVRLVKTCSCLPCVGLVRAFERAQPGEADERLHNHRDLALTGGEMDILQLVADGCSNKEIGDRLFIAESTTKNRLTAVFIKLNVQDRTQAAILALDLGFVSRGGFQPAKPVEDAL
jgi:DNA-binding NarL/FixJ family response regulator